MKDKNNTIITIDFKEPQRKIAITVTGNNAQAVCEEYNYIMNALFPMIVVNMDAGKIKWDADKYKTEEIKHGCKH